MPEERQALTKLCGRGGEGREGGREEECEEIESIEGLACKWKEEERDDKGTD